MLCSKVMEPVGAGPNERPGISAALIGPETIGELEANAAAGAVDLAPELLERVDAIGQAQ